jgi:hypothetical protein
MPCTIAHCPTFAMILWLKMSILKHIPETGLSLDLAVRDIER